MGAQAYIGQEADLREYINVIIKRKKIILAIFLLSIVAAGLISSTLPVSYLSQAIIQNGRPISLSDTERRDAKEIIDSYDFLEAAIKGLGLNMDTEQFREYISFEDLKGGKYLLLKVKYPDKDIAFKSCQLVTDLYIRQGNVLYQESSALISDFLKEVEQQVQFYRSNIDGLRALAAKASSDVYKSAKINTSPPIFGLYSNLIGYTSNLNSLIEKRNGLLALLSNRREFKIIRPPSQPKYPVQANRKSYILAGVVIGLMGGVLLAFFMEYLKNNHRKHNNPKGAI